MNCDMFLNSDDKLMYELGNLYRCYGYRQFKMSKFEEYDLYVKNKNFLISDNIITFTDTNGKLMALKPDVTLSIVNSSTDSDFGIDKLYYRENVYRPDNESRYFKEIVQMGLECIGDLDDLSISEALFLASKSLQSVSNDYIIDISDMDLISEIINREFVPADKKGIIIEYLSRKNKHELEQFCLNFGLNYLPFKSLLSCEGSPSIASNILKSIYKDSQWITMVDRFISLVSILPSEKVRIDFSVNKDDNYYNGIVFSGYVKGISTSILSGGQYDNLMRKIGRKSKAIGFALYLDKVEDYLYITPEYDVDMVLVYGANDNIIDVMSYADNIRSTGKTVIVLSFIPKDIRYRDIIYYNEKSEG